MQKNCKIICICQKKAVPLHPLLSRSSSYLALLERFTTRAKNVAGSSSARLECLLWEQEVVSSNLAYPTKQGARKGSLFVKLIIDS